jgi:hypothetical protein
LKDTQGQTLHSFKILTINADKHPLVNLFQKAYEEKAAA